MHQAANPPLERRNETQRSLDVDPPLGIGIGRLESSIGGHVKEDSFARLLLLHPNSIEIRP